MDHQAIAIAVLVVTILWLAPGWRWRIKAGLAAMFVAATIVIIVAPNILG